MIFSNGATQRSTKPYQNGLLVFKHETALWFPNAGKLPLCLTCFHKNFGVPTGETVSGARYVWHQASSNKRTPWEKHIFNRRIYDLWICVFQTGLVPSSHSHCQVARAKPFLSTSAPLSHGPPSLPSSAAATSIWATQNQTYHLGMVYSTNKICDFGDGSWLGLPQELFSSSSHDCPWHFFSSS